jgi:mannobiose 2-epimerase
MQTSKLMGFGAGDQVVLSKMQDLLIQYRIEVRDELENILEYWMRFAIDNVNGGFVGRVDHTNKIDHHAPKGAVLNSRILWTFSAAYIATRKKEYLEFADRAFEFVSKYIIDTEYGGVFWTVDAYGQPLDTKKQIYALAFAVYGLSEYYRASSNESAKQLAINLYHDVVNHSYDAQFGGYSEAFTREWKPAGDLRLSEKDANAAKSMNTNLHVLEAFSTLYQIWPDSNLRKQVSELVEVFIEKIISNSSYHLNLFFNSDWKTKSNIISYGHDIEAAWLIQEAAEAIHDGELVDRVKEYSFLIAQAAEEGLDIDGGLWYELDRTNPHFVKQKHWWPQAEAMVGFFNAWQVTSHEKFLWHSIRSWRFVQRFIKDKEEGEWTWGVTDDYSTMLNEDKIGLWKCPYHNSRACMEIIRRVTLSGAPE